MDNPHFLTFSRLGYRTDDPNKKVIGKFPHPIPPSPRRIETAILQNRTAILQNRTNTGTDLKGLANTQLTLKSNQGKIKTQIQQNRNKLTEVKQDLDCLESTLEQMLEEGYTNSYRQVPIDLSVEHTDEPAGILVEGRNYLWLTVVKADDDFTFKLNGAGNPSITGQVGVKLEKHLFTEIYYSNTVGSGEARIIVGWRE